MIITGVSNTDSYVADFQSGSKSTSATATSATGIDSISLSANAWNSIAFNLGNAPDPSNYLSMFSTLNLDILDYPNLSAVGNAIDTYTKSLANSNVYESSYTAPSVKYLADLAHLKAAASSGDLAGSESWLATAKLDGPDSVAGRYATAVATGTLRARLLYQ